MTIRLHDVPGAHCEAIGIPALLAVGMPLNHVIWRAPFTAKIRSIVVAWSANLTGGAVNYTRVVVTNRGTDGTGVTALATVNYNAGAVTGFRTYSLYAPATYLDVASGTVISIALSAVNAGEDMPPGTIFIFYEGA